MKRLTLPRLSFIRRDPWSSFTWISLGPWCISNVSIIYEAFMLYYYLFWMFMGFIIRFYIIFGTNLLTGGPAHIAVFLPISVFWRKGISNGVQTESKRNETFGSVIFWNGSDPGDLELKSRKLRGGHEGGGCPPTGCAPYLMGPSRLPRPTSFAYICPYTLKTSRNRRDREFRRRKPL